MYLKAQILDNKKYSFDKAKQGSMKDFVADRYIFGYHMVSYGSSAIFFIFCAVAANRHCSSTLDSPRMRA